MLIIDVETRSELKLNDVGAWKYAQDPSTDWICLAYMHDSWSEPRILYRGQEPDRNAFHRQDIMAFNADFERAICQHVFKYPMPGLDRWHDLAAWAAQRGLPNRLDECCKVLGLPELKDEEGHKLMLKMSRPITTSDDIQLIETPKWIEDPASLKRLGEYCMQDVKAEMELYRRLKNSAEPVHIWRLHQRINERGFPVDLENARLICDQVQDFKDKKIKESIAKYGVSPMQVSRMKELLENEDCIMEEGLTKTAVSAAISGDVSDTARELLELRQQVSASSVKKYTKLIQCAGSGNRIRGAFQYYGANTGRFSGKGFQPQNLPRGSYTGIEPVLDLKLFRDVNTIVALYGDVVDCAASAIRACICAPDGHVLVDADYSAVEGRGLAWIAGEDDILDAYRQGKDLYKVAASAIYGVPETEVTKAQRQIGKISELACGYQGGHNAFNSMAANYGVVVPEEEAKTIVRKWRAGRSGAVRLWNQIEEAAVQAVSNPGTPVSYRQITYNMEEDWLTCQLPSGRKIYYFRPTLHRTANTWGSEKMSLCYEGKDPKRSGRFTRIWTYGGKLTENIVQAVCRDLLIDAMKRAADTGLCVVLHVHDEICCEAREEEAETTLQQLIRIMSTAPDWASGFPLNAEGWIARRFKK